MALSGDPRRRRIGYQRDFWRQQRCTAGRSVCTSGGSTERSVVSDTRGAGNHTGSCCNIAADNRTHRQAPVEAPAENPIAAAFEQKTAENTKKGLLEKPPVFYHKGVKEEIDDPSMTFEELRIRKSDDFTDLEEGKRVSWSVEYCGIRKEVKDPKGTTIHFHEGDDRTLPRIFRRLKKTKDKDPCCYVKPKVEMKTKGNAAYKGKFGTLEEARTSDKVIC